MKNILNFHRVSKLSALSRKAFTLVEILVSLGVLSVLLLISAEVIGTVQTTWTSTNARVSQFREARTAFDIITRNISQATLGSYLDYDTNYLANADANAATTTAPSKYLRASDLRFVCGVASNPSVIPSGGGVEFMPGHAVFFQAPLGVVHDPQFVGLDRLLCGRGYFVQYTSDEYFRPPFINTGNPKFRYRLIEYSPPAETNLIFSDPTNKQAWLQQAGLSLRDSQGRSGGAGEESAINRGVNRPIADNIIALVVCPLLDASSTAATSGSVAPTAIAPNFTFNSMDVGALQNAGGYGEQGTQHLLPPMVRIVLVAIDERSAEIVSQRFGGGDGQTPPFGDQIHQAIQSGGAAALNQSLVEVARILRDEFRVNYRIFSTTVALRGARWSS